MKHEKYSDATRRKVVETWTLENNYRVKVYTYHDKIKKAYWSIISECRIEASGTSGIYFEKHNMCEDLNQLAGKVEGLRYNYEKLSAAHEAAAASVADQVAQLLAAHEEVNA